MKITKIKKIGCYPYNRFIDFKQKNKKYKCLAEVLQNGAGCYVITKRGEEIYSSYDANINDWIKDIEEKINELKIVQDFLLDVNILRQEDKYNITEK